MKTLKAFIYTLILSIFLFNSGCNPKIDEPSPNVPKSLLGRWEMDVYIVSKRDKDATTSRLLGTFGKGLAYIFYDNNTFDGCIQAGSDWDNAGVTGTSGQWNCTSNKPGIWELKDFIIVNGSLKTGSYIILRTPSQNITQKFWVDFHTDTKLELVLEETKDIDGSVTWATVFLKKVN